MLPTGAGAQKMKFWNCMPCYLGYKYLELHESLVVYLQQLSLMEKKDNLKTLVFTRLWVVAPNLLSQVVDVVETLFGLAPMRGLAEDAEVSFDDLNFLSGHRSSAG